MKKTPAKIKRPLWVVGLNLALALTVGSTKAFADTLITSQADLEAIGIDPEFPLGGEYFVTGSFAVGEPTFGNTYVVGTFTGTFDGNGKTISGLTKPLFDVSSGNILNLNLVSTVGIDGNGALANILDGGTIDSVSFTGDISGESDLYMGFAPVGIGGLVGLQIGATISNSYAAGTVDGDNYVGGLVGFQYVGDISNSYATSTVTGSGDNVGGLVGFQFLGGISNSYATSTVTGSGDNVGGLVGFSSGTISYSYASGDVRGGAYDIGGLVGEVNLFGSITNSYATGNVEGIGKVGGLVGFSSGTISYSYGYGEATINGAPIEEDPHLGKGDAPEILSIVNFGFADPNLPFAVSASINDGLPYLISLIESYDVAVTPSFNLRSYYTQAAKSLNKALISLGFKSNFSSHPNLGFKALEQNQSNSPAVIQLFELSEYQNSNILLNKDDGLQLSISSYYKEAVEIWTQGLNGEYLYLGLIEFDKDGKAILPTLKFDTANTYQLLMIKAADKLSEKPNLEAKVGQININVI